MEVRNLLSHCLVLITLVTHLIGLEITSLSGPSLENSPSMVAAPFYTILTFTAKFPFMNLHSRKPAGPECWEHPVLFCPSHNCGYDADGDSGQEGVQRPGYRGELHPGYLQYILPAAYLLHSHRVLVLTWGLSVSMWPQDVMTSTLFSNLSYSGRLLVLVGTIFLIINKALD